MTNPLHDRILLAVTSTRVQADVPAAVINAIQETHYLIDKVEPFDDDDTISVPRNLVKQAWDTLGNGKPFVSEERSMIVSQLAEYWDGDLSPVVAAPEGV